MKTSTNAVLKAHRDPDTMRLVQGARAVATQHRQRAELEYRQLLALASRWEHYAALLENGVEQDEATRVAFKNRGQ